MILSIHQPHYLPWLGYFDKILKSDHFVFLDMVQYKHREYQNRNKIRTKDGWMWLTVPVVTKGLREQLIRDVKIDNETNWQKTHRRSLSVSYGNAPFFEQYEAFFEDVYGGKTWDSLCDLNVSTIKFILKEMEIETPLSFESELGTTTKGTERIIEICKKLDADVYLSGTGGKEYLEEGRFAEEGIELKYQEFSHPAYSQGDGKFLPAMAAADLLFNEGPKSREILEKE